MMLGLRRIRDCDRGASAVEMGLAAPFLLVLLVGIVDVSRAYSDRLVLEQAAQRTIEKVAQQRSVESDYSSLQAEAAAAADVPTGNVTVDFWLECDGVRAPDFNGVCADGETYARYVTVSIDKTFTPVIGSQFVSSNEDGTYTLTAEAGVRVQ